MAKDNIKLTISAKDLASGTLGRVKASTIALGTAVGILGAKMVTAALNGVRRWVNEALEAERANVMLDAALRGTGNYSEALSRQMRDLAGAIQDETGAIDEAVKSNIAMLLTMGTAPAKMGEAARAVQALAALNYEGSQAARAVALAMEGNMLGFNRLVPAVRNAKTEEEKVLAVNALLSAGYEQQKANLQTVGGAWGALKGRLGDAREAIIGAIFEGLQLGQTFEGMQAAVGKFLKSDSFQSFTNRLRDGAAYVRDIVNAMDTAGGTKEIMSAIAGVILGALKDGAEYISVKITNAFSGLKSAFGETRVRVATAVGTPEDEARRVVYGKPAQYKGGATEAALANLENKVKVRVSANEKTAAAEVSIADSTVATQAAQIDIEDAKKRDRDALEKAAAADEMRARHAAKITAIQADIEAAAERERQAQDKAAKLQEQRNGAIEQNINAWIAGVQGRRDDAAKNEQDLEQAKKRADTLQRKQDRGTKLSKRDAQWLEDFERNQALRQPGRAQNAADAAAAAAKARQEMEQRLAKVQDDQLKELKSLNKNLESSLEVS